AHLLLIGSGDTKSNIKRVVLDNKIENKVTFLSNRDDVEVLMKAMNIFIFPSKHEGFGNVLLEAQALKLKCVVSNNVPRATRVTNLVTFLSLEESIDRWGKELIEDGVDSFVDSGLRNYDICNVVKRLEKIYEDYTIN